MSARRTLLAAAPLALGYALLAGPAAAQAAQQARSRLRAVILAIEPLAYLDQKGRQTGVFVDILNELIQETGVAIDVLVVPYARAAAMLAADRAELIASIPDEKLNAENESLGVLAYLEVTAVGRRGMRLERLQDLRGKTVAYLRGAHYGAPLDTAEFIRYETNSHEQGLKMLLERRVDAVVGGNIGLQHAMRKLAVPPDRVGVALNLYPTHIDLMMTRRVNDPALVERLRKGMQALHARGRVEALLARYTS